MKKIITTISLFAIPFVSFAQNYIYKYDGFTRGDMTNMSPLLFILVMILIPAILVIVSILAFVFWVVMLIDAIRNSSEQTKVVWVLVIILTHIVGALIYYFAEKRERDSKKKHKNPEAKE